MSTANTAQSEYISAAFDNEASEMEIRRLLKRLNSGNPDAAETALTQWQSFQNVSDGLQGSNTNSDLQFLQRLNQRIGTEVQAVHWSRKIIQRYGRIASQTALAASISIFTIIGVQQYQLAQYNADSPEQIAIGGTYTPTQFPQQFLVPIVNTQPVSASTSYTRPAGQEVQKQPVQINNDGASESEAPSQQ